MQTMSRVMLDATDKDLTRSVLYIYTIVHTDDTV